VLTIHEFIQIYLDRAAPWIAVWLGAVALDMLFGGPRVLGLIPSLERLPTRTLQFFQTKLVRNNRSRRTHLWRGSVVTVVLVLLFGAVGYAVDQLVFIHPSMTALAVFFVAKFLSLKIAWQQLQSSSAKPGAADYRQLTRKPIEVFGNYYVPAALLFVVGGFAFLLVFHCLHAANIEAEKAHKARKSANFFFLIPLQRMRSLLAIPGEISAAIVLIFASLFWPPANWKRSLSAIRYLGARVRHWPVIVTNYAFNWSLEAHSISKATALSSQKAEPIHWIGPETGSAKLNATDQKNGLIVALIAFGLANTLLALLWLAALIG